MFDNDFKTGLVLMASGLGKRFGSNKLMTSADGKPLIQWGIDASENVFDVRVVVTRHEEVKKLCEGLGIDCIIHDFPGRNDTIRLGLSHLMGEIDYCFFMPGDQPLISSESLYKLVDNAKNNPEMIIRSCYGDKIGTPVGFPKKCFEELLNLPQDNGGKYVLEKYPQMIKMVSLGSERELWDVDTVEDLQKMLMVSNS